MNILVSNFEKVITDKLSEELGDEKTAQRIAPYINNIIFSHSPPYINVSDTKVLVAFAFGNRPNSTGNKNELAEPGPMNKSLADCCAEVYRKKPMPMYLQWEIARFFQKGDYPDILLSDVFSIEPHWNENGELEYLSTEGVINVIIKDHFGGDPKAMGKTTVIAHRDHIKRSVIVCRSQQVQGYAPESIVLPVWYDDQSAQAWTRRRDLYILRDISVQLLSQAQQNIIEAYPPL